MTGIAKSREGSSFLNAIEVAFYHKSNVVGGCIYF